MIRSYLSIFPFPQELAFLDVLNQVIPSASRDKSESLLVIDEHVLQHVASLPLESVLVQFQL